MPALQDTPLPPPHIVSLPLDCHRLKSVIELVKCRNMLSHDNEIPDCGQVIGGQFDNSSSKSNLKCASFDAFKTFLIFFHRCAEVMQRYWLFCLIDLPVSLPTLSPLLSQPCFPLPPPVLSWSPPPSTVLVSMRHEASFQPRE